MPSGPLFAFLGIGAAVAALAAASSAQAAPPPPAGTTPQPGLDLGIDPETSRAVLQALQTETDPANLVRFAHAIGENYPIAAGALVAKAAALQSAARAGQAAIAAAAGLPAQASTYATPAAEMPPSTPPNAQPTVTAVPTYAPPAPAPPAYLPPPPIVSTQSAPDAPWSPPATVRPPSPPAPAAPPPAPILQGYPPTGPGTWVSATDLDVRRDGVATRYAELLAQAVGSTVTETHNGHVWQLRVISHASDPTLTPYAKDVHGWIWHGQTEPGPVPMPMPAPVPIVAPRTIASVPPNMDLAQVQANLNVLHTSDPALVVDGRNGPKTIGAVKLFQMQHGLTVDGIAGPLTKAAIAQALAGQPPARSTVTPPAVTQTMPIVTMRDVQVALNVLGARPPLTADGIGGPLTKAQVTLFQQSKHCRGCKVDGIAGPQTKAAIAKALSEKASQMVASGAARPAGASAAKAPAAAAAAVHPAASVHPAAVSSSPATPTPEAPSGSAFSAPPGREKRISEKSLVPPPKSATSTVASRSSPRANENAAPTGS